MIIVLQQFFLVAPDSTDDDLVDAHYVARRHGCSVRSVQARKYGTGEIPRFSDRPLRFRREDVHEALRRRAEQMKTPRERGRRRYLQSHPRVAKQKGKRAMRKIA